MTQLKEAFAFWEYDLFPYVVGAKTSGQVHRQGSVSIPSMGCYVVPKHLTSAERGLDFKATLDVLETEYRLEKDKLHKEYVAKALLAAPWLKGFKAYSKVTGETK